MSEKLKLNNEAMVFDIETVSPDFESLDSETKAYLIERIEKDPRNHSNPDPVETQAKNALVNAWGLNKVICIGIRRTDKAAGILLQESAEIQEHKACEGYAVLFGPEKYLLEQFWQRVKAAYLEDLRLVSFFGEGFDLPNLIIRSAMNGVTPTVFTMSGRYARKTSFHLDLDNVLSFKGIGKHFSLDYWCRRFEVNSPKDSMKGSMVGQAYRDGKIDEIGAYCMKDTFATMELYKKLDATILPTFFE